MSNLWQRLNRYTQGIILIMCSFLFLTWGIFGSAQVDKQTNRILESVHQDIERAAGDVIKNQEVLIASTDYISCLLNWRPEERTPKVYHRCYRQSGLKQLRG